MNVEGLQTSSRLRGQCELQLPEPPAVHACALLSAVLAQSHSDRNPVQAYQQLCRVATVAIQTLRTGPMLHPSNHLRPTEN